MPRMKGGEAVIETLLHEGVEVVFGIPGVHTLEIYDALYHRPQIQHIVARHEQGAAFMADGYARASGKTGVVLAITGPGVTNAATGLGEAYADGSPVLIISSEVDSRHRGKGNLHELKDQLGVLRAITLWNACAESVGDIPMLIHQALEKIWEGWPGPVHVQIPIDILAAEDEVAFAPQAQRVRRVADEQAIEQAMALLAAAERPMIFAGWGVTLADANAELRQLAEYLQAPVLGTPLGKGVLPDDHPLALGSAWREAGEVQRLVETSDVCLVVGSRLSAMETRSWSIPLPKHLIHIDPDPANINHCYPTQVGLVGDPQATLARLLEGLEPGTKPSRASQVAVAKAEMQSRIEERSPEMAQVMADLRAALEQGVIVSLDPTLPTYWASTYLSAPRPRSVLNPYHFMTLGFGLPAGIGAAIACPERPIVVVCGDGGFMYTLQELATAVKYGLNLKVLVFNNDCYGAIRRHQERRYEGRVIDADLVNPDFLALGQAFGVRSIRLNHPGELGDMLQQALATEALWLIEVPSHTLPAPW
ncbi:MAG: thiamine pyrophosphate-binding protein [Anaerolineae bacterium]|nr:thiamine pyrophosphate-binding protein [Anaerolineae bacterium]